MASLTEIREALFAIPCCLPYEERAKIGRSLYSELGDSGIDLYADWLGDSHSGKKVAREYRAFKSTTAVTIGTLFFYAKQYGWSPDRDINQAVSAEQRRIDEHGAAKRKKKRELELKALEAERLRQFQHIQKRHNELPAGKGPYLERKVGNLFTVDDRIKRGDGYIVFPLFDVKGNIHGYQQIFDNGFKKVTGHQQGNYFVLGGELTGVVYIAEGLATGITVQAATGRPVIVCINAGNIPNVVTAIKAERLPVTIIGASDHDQWAGDSGFPSHAGKRYSEKAGIQYSMPTFDSFKTIHSTKPTDFNDLYHLGGLDLVRAQLAGHTGITSEQVHSKYLKVDELKQGLTLLKSAKGTGKTTAIGGMLPKDLKILIISYRVLLNEKLAKDLNADFYKDLIVNSDNSLLRASNRLVITPHSLWRLEGSRWDMVVIDEAEQTLGEICGSTMKGKRCITLELLSAFLFHSKYQIMADADLNETTMKFCRDLGMSGRLIENTHKPMTGAKMYVYEDYGQLYNHFTDRVKTEPLYFCSNTKDRINTLDNTLSEEGLKTQLITSEIHKTIKREFIANMDQEVMGLDALLCSPSAGTGLDISQHPFKATYGAFGSTTGTVEQAHQQLARARNVDEYHLYLPPNRENRPTHPDAIRKQLLDGVAQATTEIVGLDYQDLRLKIKHEQLADLYCNVTAHTNKSRNSFKELFIQQAIDEGYEIIYVSKNELEVETGKAVIKLSKDELAQQLEQSITEGETMLEDDYLNADESVTHTARYQKTKVHRALGVEGDELNRITMAEIKNRYLSKIRKNELAAKPSDETKLMDLQDVKTAEIIDLQHYSVQRQLYRKIRMAAGIDDDLNHNGATWDNKKLSSFTRWAKENEHKFNGLGMQLPRDLNKNPVKFFNYLLSQMAITPVIVSKNGKGKNANRTYGVDVVALAEVKRHVLAFRERNVRADSGWARKPSVLKNSIGSSAHHQEPLQASNHATYSHFNQPESLRKITENSGCFPSTESATQSAGGR